MNRLSIIFSTLLISLCLVLFANFPAWKWHLSSDTDGFYFARASHFIKNYSLENLGSNEYQPGAIIFFLLASPLLLIDTSVELYRTGIWIMNLSLFWLLTFLFYKKTTQTQTFVFQLIVLSAGPIILFRFEFFVFLMLFLSIHFLQKQKIVYSGIWMSLATLTKIFPIIIIPYFLFYIFKKYSLLHALTWVWGFLVTFFVFLSLYTFLLKTSPNQLLEDMAIHSKKPVHVESLWGSGLTLLEYFNSGEFARGKGATGIFGIDPLYQLGSLSFYNYFWILPWGLLFLWGIKRHWNDNENFSIDFLILLTLFFIIFSKIVTAQYLFWFSLFIPLLYWSKENFNRNQTIVFLMLFTNLLTQYIYPLNYSSFLGTFYEIGQDAYLFYLLTLRNTLLIILFIYIFWTYPKKKKLSFLSNLINRVTTGFKANGV